MPTLAVARAGVWQRRDKQRQQDNRRGVIFRKLVHKALHRGAPLLGLLHQAQHAGEGGICCQLRHRDLKARP